MGLCTVSAGRGANQPSCGYECAIVALAASPYDCQSEMTATPVQNVIRRGASARDGRLRHDGCPLGNGTCSGFKSTRRTNCNKPTYLERAEPLNALILNTSPRVGLCRDNVRLGTDCRSAFRHIRQKAPNV